MIRYARDVVISLYGVWRLAHFDPRGHACFDASPEGARRSFFAAVLVAPFYALMLAVLPPAAQTTADAAAHDTLRPLLMEIIAYVITWTAYPVVVEALSRPLGVRKRFEGYLTAYNWSMVLQYAVFMPITILVGLGWVPPDLGQLCWLVAFVLMFAFLWFVARSALGVPPATAAGLVILDVLLSMLIDGITISLS